MLREPADDAARLRWREASPYAVALLSYILCGAVIAAYWPEPVNALSLILGVAAAMAGLLAVGEQGGLGVSAAYIVYVLAAAFLGPGSAAAAAVISELAASVRSRPGGD